MKGFFYSLLLVGMINIGFSDASKSINKTSGALGSVMKSLNITAEEVENNNVLLVSTNLKLVKQKPQLTKVTTFLLYLSAANSAPKEGILAFLNYDRFKLVDQKTLMSSKDFLQAVIANHPEALVQNLALVTLGMTFPGNSEILEFLQDQYFFSRADDARKSAILKALTVGKFHAPLIIRSALYSTNRSLIVNAAAAVKQNHSLYPDLLPNLVSALLTVNTKRDEYQAAYSFLCQSIMMYKEKRQYLSLFRKLMKKGPSPQLHQLILESSKK